MTVWITFQFVLPASISVHCAVPSAVGFFEALSVTLARGNSSVVDGQVSVRAFSWQVFNRENIFFVLVKLVTTKPSVQNLFCLHLVKTFLIYVDNDAENIAMVFVRSVDLMWNRDSHTLKHTDHLKLSFFFSSFFSLPILPCGLWSIRNWMKLSLFKHCRWNRTPFTHREIGHRSSAVPVLCTQNLCCVLCAHLA